MTCPSFSTPVQQCETDPVPSACLRLLTIHALRSRTLQATADALGGAVGTVAGWGICVVQLRRMWISLPQLLD